MNLALFDFDGTITTQDTYTRFILSTTTGVRRYLGALLLLPVIILYKLGVLRAATVRPLISRAAFIGVSQTHLRTKAEVFVRDYIPTITRREMLQKINTHKDNGDRVIIVSASLSPYLEIWCEHLGVELICSELDVRNSRYTGKYVNGDCSGQAKVDRILHYLNIDEFSHIVAYGDTEEDFPMLHMAHTSYFRGTLYRPCKPATSQPGI